MKGTGENYEYEARIMNNRAELIAGTIESLRSTSYIWFGAVSGDVKRDAEGTRCKESDTHVQRMTTQSGLIFLLFSLANSRL